MAQDNSLDLELQSVGKRYPSAQAEGGVLQVLTGVDLASRPANSCPSSAPAAAANPPCCA